MDDITYEGPQDGHGAYLPTPEEIAAACKRIQSTWTPAEFYRRAGKRVPARFAQAQDELSGRMQSVSILGRLGDDVAEPVEE